MSKVAKVLDDLSLNAHWVFALIESLIKLTEVHFAPSAKPSDNYDIDG